MTDGTKTLLVIAGVTTVTATVLSYLTRDSRRDYATGIRGWEDEQDAQDAWERMQSAIMKKRLAKRGQIHVVIKGEPKNAKREAQRRGIVLRDCKKAKDEITRCIASSVHEKKLAKWMGAQTTKKKGRGFSPGTLLFYR